MQRHRHQEFIRFLNTIEAQVPAGKLIHVILDNYAAHKHPKVRQWLDNDGELAIGQRRVRVREFIERVERDLSH